jgi:hypothetical protein
LEQLPRQPAPPVQLLEAEALLARTLFRVLTERCSADPRGAGFLAPFTRYCLDVSDGMQRAGDAHAAELQPRIEQLLTEGAMLQREQHLLEHELHLLRGDEAGMAGLLTALTRDLMTYPQCDFFAPYFMEQASRRAAAVGSSGASTPDMRSEADSLLAATTSAFQTIRSRAPPAPPPRVQQQHPTIYHPGGI